MKNYDKLLHFFVGLAIYVFFSLAFDPLTGFLVTMLAGIGKEIYDYFSEDHEADFCDFFTTVLVPFILVLNYLAH